MLTPAAHEVAMIGRLAGARESTVENECKRTIPTHALSRVSES